MSLPVRFINQKIIDHDKMTYGKDRLSYRKDLMPGDANWEDYDNGTIFAYVCPCGCGFANFVSVYEGETGHGWKWDGNRERPTLSPSLQQNNVCRWHGFVREGLFVNAD